MMNAIKRVIRRMTARRRLKRMTHTHELRAYEDARRIKSIDMSLIAPYTSLSRKFEIISAFCNDHPEDIERLKELESYQNWREFVIDWARENLDRLAGFYFNDGIFMYIASETPSGLRLIDLRQKYNYPPEPGYEVMCDVEIKDQRVPDDYFDLPDIVWEEEDQEKIWKELDLGWGWTCKGRDHFYTRTNPWTLETETRPYR